MDKKVTIQIRNFEPWQETAEMMADVGFKYVAMGFGDEKPLLKDDWKDHVYKMAEVFDKCGLKCVQTHAPYYDLLISAEKRDENMEKALLRSMEATKILGAAICAVQPRSYIIDGAP
ncbi:MAG: hypothetical protein J5903_04180, partial [Clostridia bacterium]|nr:hypothetical protein [Clostridia bacterium]